MRDIPAARATGRRKGRCPHLEGLSDGGGRGLDPEPPVGRDDGETDR